MGVRSLGVRLEAAAASCCALDGLFLCGVATTCGSFDAARLAVGLWALLEPGSGRSGISGRMGSSVCGEDAVCQLSSDLIEVSAEGVGAFCRRAERRAMFARCADQRSDVSNKVTGVAKGAEREFGGGLWVGGGLLWESG